MQLSTTELDYFGASGKPGWKRKLKRKEEEERDRGNSFSATIDSV